MFGIGGSFLYFPCLTAPQQWFTTKRGLAVGVAMSGSGIGGLIISNIVQACIIHLGYRWALRITGFVCFALILVATVLIKHPKNAKQNRADSFSTLCHKQKKLLMNKQFQIMLAMGTVTTFGYLVGFFQIIYGHYCYLTHPCLYLLFRHPHTI
jgi:MFS family permease